ncbi:MAG: hypothetical protein MJD61_08180 [Proteobacteria bacterium]|nr:hypothetical protein [Pseudomonadota bacterium]
MRRIPSVHRHAIQPRGARPCLVQSFGPGTIPPWIALGLVLAGVMTLPIPARAVGDPQEPGLVRGSSLLDDPIGLPERDGWLEPPHHGSKQRRQQQEATRYGPYPPPQRSRAGQVLTGMAASREARHQVDVLLQGGLARVVTRLELTTTLTKPSEIGYRLAVPRSARLAGLEVCNAAGCRKGLRARVRGHLTAYDDAVQARGPGFGLPVARAIRTSDARGSAIVLHAAPLVAGNDLRLRIAYVAAAPLRGGAVRLHLPARGMDPRAANSEISVRAQGLHGLRVAERSNAGAPVTLQAWEPCQVSARAPAAARVDRWRFGCGSSVCERIRVAAGSRPGKPVDLIALVDASPSTEGPARNRMMAAVASLLEAAPQGSIVRGAAFGARAAVLLDTPLPADRAPLEPFEHALAMELGSATRFEAAWNMVRPWLRKRPPGGAGNRLGHHRRQLIVIVGDGDLMRSGVSTLGRAAHAGVEVSLLNVGDRPTPPALEAAVARSRGIVVHAGEEAHNLTRGGDPTPLLERVGALFAPVVRRRLRLRLGRGSVVLGALRAGEQRVWQGTVSGQVRLSGAKTPSWSRPPHEMATALGDEPAATVAPSVLMAVDPRDLRSRKRDRPPPPAGSRPCDARGPAFRHSGISSDAEPIYLAERRDCRPPVAPKPSGSQGWGMPAGPLRQMLRRRVLPVARGCFRRDRAGRADYAVRAVFAFELANREVMSVQVEGDLGPELRACLQHAVDGLEVPRFTGRVIVRYPLVTLAESSEAVIELPEDLATAVDSVAAPAP